MNQATENLLHSLDSAELRARAFAEGNALRVTFAGCADSRVMADLNELLTRVHDDASGRKAPEVVVDFRELEFMNSSCFKAFVSWIARVQELEESAQYRIRFLSDEAKHWQRRSLGALSCFAVDLIRIES